MPMLGLGTWKSKPDEVYEAVKMAIDAGYTHIDCAFVYENEHEVGRAVKEKIAGGAVTREKLWLTSKLWNTHRTPELARPALEKTLSDLGVKYLDLYLIHWPQDFAPQPVEPGRPLFPKDEDGKPLFGHSDYVAVWAEMEKFVTAGLVRNIGISNFNHNQIDRILASCKIRPAVLQVESHPYLAQSKLVAYCKGKGIAVEAYAPFGAPDRSWAKPGDPILLEDPLVRQIAEKHKRTPAQVLVRFQLERGVVVIPKSVNKQRLQQNIDAVTFRLDEGELNQLLTLDRHYRYYGASNESAHPHFAFSSEY